VHSRAVRLNDLTTEMLRPAAAAGCCFQLSQPPLKEPSDEVCVAQRTHLFLRDHDTGKSRREGAARVVEMTVGAEALCFCTRTATSGSNIRHIRLIGVLHRGRSGGKRSFAPVGQVPGAQLLSGLLALLHAERKPRQVGCGAPWCHACCKRSWPGGTCEVHSSLVTRHSSHDFFWRVPGW
jgi:hypothetical protein